MRHLKLYEELRKPQVGDYLVVTDVTVDSNRDNFELFMKFIVD